MTSSILTNNGANSALMTLRGISYDLGVTQDRISSGLMVADASHNASVYATAQVMRSDIGSYDVIARTLSVSVSALGTALKSTQDIADQVQVIRDKVSEAWSSELAEVDKLQADVDQALSQINTIANGATFKGLNMVNNGQSQRFLASVDRSADGVLVSNYISVASANLRQGAGGGLEALAGLSGANNKIKTTGIDAPTTGAGVTVAAPVVIPAAPAVPRVPAVPAANATVRTIVWDASLVDPSDMHFFDTNPATTPQTLTFTFDPDGTGGPAVAEDVAVRLQPNVLNYARLNVFLNHVKNEFNVASPNGTAPTVGAGTAREVTVTAAVNAAGNGIIFTLTPPPGTANAVANQYLVGAKNGNLSARGKAEVVADKFIQGVAGVDAAPAVPAVPAVEGGFSNSVATFADAARRNGNYTLTVNSNGLEYRITKYNGLPNTAPEAITQFSARQRSIIVRSEAEVKARLESLSDVESATFGVAGTDENLTLRHKSGAAIGLTAAAVSDADAQTFYETLSVNTLDAKLQIVNEAYDRVNKAAADFGTRKNRLESQVTFVKEVSRLLTAGLGTMVDADMTVEAARLRALQTQQQLASQALSIANNAPQSLLTLFRS